MLEIKDITKDYKTTSDTVHALRGVSVAFRDSELVAVLGHSGCGKTTLLNIIGGLDRYTTGDLIINGRSTKQYKDRDWDTYRNHSIGFIFQSYNLIPHQSVLSNVELALTLSGVSKTERRRRAKEALEKVGLGDQMYKRPNQMSGGQMQRVAIARALVNDPEILLADEPTGALDSETSLQIMDLVKEIAQDRLVIMVTHNPDLAHDYSTRIVKLVDGRITSDTNPFDPAADEATKKSEATGTADEREARRLQANEKAPAERVKKSDKKSSMSFWTALSLSKNNLLTKKGRTFLTSFAGSIGIIGIALILSLSNGVQQYINNVEHTTLASYPVTIQAETVDYTSLMGSMMGIKEESLNEKRDPDKIYTNDISTEMIKTMLSEIRTNNITEFKDYLESNPDNILDSISEIQYSYSPKLYIYGKDVNDKVMQVNPSTAMQSMLGDFASSFGQMSDTYSQIFGSGGGSPYDVWNELLKDEMTNDQYEVLAGRLPQKYDEVVLIVNKDNEMSDVTLYTLGLRDQAELKDMWGDLLVGNAIDLDTGDMVFTYDELLGMNFRLIIPSDFYKANADGGYDDMRSDADYMQEIYDKSLEINVVGIVRPGGDSLINTSTSGGIGYIHALTEYLIETTNNSELVKKQQENPDVDVFTGVPFPTEDEEEKQPMSQEEAFAKVLEFMSPEQLGALAQAVMQTLPEEKIPEIMALPQEQQFAKIMELAEPAKIMSALMGVLTQEQIEKLQEMTKAPEKTEATYKGNLDILGVADLDKPSTMSIYAKDFDGKERLADFIKEYNNKKAEEGKQEDAINYSDYVGMMISSVSTIIDAISYILIAFVAISLVVSSIMIGIITYISVLERTKEIGILRAMGASKHNISNVFNAETLIVGLAAGVIGIGVTLLLNIPINIIIEYLTGIGGMSKLPPLGGVILVIISMMLTLIAGLFPAKVASRKDPVEALRTE